MSVHVLLYAPDFKQEIYIDLTNGYVSFFE